MKRIRIASGIAAAVAVAGAAIWYYVSAQQVSKEWARCGSDKKSLLVAADRDYWDEWRKPLASGDRQILEEACAERTEVVNVQLQGLSATAHTKVWWPELNSWDELMSFPATATHSQKVALVRERLEKTQKWKEHDSTVDLRWEAYRWRVALNLEPKIRFSRQAEIAEGHARLAEYDQAASIYEQLSQSSKFSMDQRKLAEEFRIQMLGRKACWKLARSFLQYPDGADFNFSSMTNEGVIRVIGSIKAPNAFGVKGSIVADCTVRFPTERPAALVDILMTGLGTAGFVSKKAVEVSLN